MSNRKEPYASEAESAAVIAPYTLSAAEKKLHDMMDERGAWEQGAETYPALYQIAIELLEREAQVVQSTTENSSAVEQPAPQGCLRCNTPKKCALYVCSPLAWPSEQPAQPQQGFPLRGILASELKCWHRLTEDEAQNLLAFVQNMPSKPAQPQQACHSNSAESETQNSLTLMDEGYYCAVCGKYIEAVDGVIVHDDIPHPDMAFDDEENPQ